MLTQAWTTRLCSSAVTCSHSVLFAGSSAVTSTSLLTSSVRSSLRSQLSQRLTSRLSRLVTTTVTTHILQQLTFTVLSQRRRLLDAIWISQVTRQQLMVSLLLLRRLDSSSILVLTLSPLLPTFFTSFLSTSHLALQQFSARMRLQVVHLLSVLHSQVLLP